MSEAQRLRNYREGLPEDKQEAEREKNAEAKKLSRAAAQFELIREIRVKSGTFSQSIERFQFVPSCLANALVAALHPKDPVSWSPADMDSILELGNELYHRVLLLRPPAEDAQLAAWDLECIKNTVRMSTASIQLVINGREIGFKYLADIFGGPLKTPEKPWKHDNQNFVPLLTALERVFTSTSRAIVLIENKWFSVLRSSKGGYIFYYSHSVDVENRVDGDGVARAFFVRTLQEMVFTVMAGVKGKVYDQLYGIEIEFDRTAPKKKRQE